MIINHGLWIIISLDGIPASISSTVHGDAFLTVYGIERTPGKRGDKYHPISPEGLPKEDDNSDFARVYRKLNTLVKNGGLKGPFGENHPRVYNRFQYIQEVSPQELLKLIEAMGVVIKVKQMDHKGDDAEVEQATKDFARWMHEDVTFKPNPKIAEAKVKKERETYWKLGREKAPKESRKFRRFVAFPVSIIILLTIPWKVFSLHWIIGVSVTSFFVFVYKRIQN